jgi:hypothetical protein
VLEKTDPAALERLALATLPTLQHPNGIFCFDRTEGGPLRGESVRYTLMVRLGLQRATEAGVAPARLDPLVVDLVHSRAYRRTPGDLGLLLWSDLRDGDDRAADVLAQLRAELDVPDAMVGLEGMEIGWIGMGLAEAARAKLPDAHQLLQRVLDHLLIDRRGRSGLYRHRLDSRVRQELPNFATEVYSLLLLARVAALDLDPRAEAAAVALGAQLIEHRRADGGWPWLYDATSGRVVEPY